MNINGTEVTIKGDLNISEKEILDYIGHIREEHPQDSITALEISPAYNGRVSLDYTLHPPKFERIRRITGYLVGNMSRWNNAKRAEEKDRVKHEMQK